MKSTTSALAMLKRRSFHAPKRSFKTGGAKGSYGRFADESLTVRLANTDGQRSAASMLLSRMYSWRGYGRNHAVVGSPNCVTFTAACKEDVVGTLTLTVDSSAGLVVDATFRDQIEPFRAAPGAKLCELRKFAFDWMGSSQRHLAALFHLVFIYGSRQFACTDLFIEVNPRHSRYYETLLGFARVGEVRTNKSVNAPSQLMWLNVGSIRRMIDQHKAADTMPHRSLYRYFFSPEEEDGLYGRLTGNQQATAGEIFDPSARPAKSPRRLSELFGGMGFTRTKQNLA